MCGRLGQLDMNGIWKGHGIFASHDAFEPLARSRALEEYPLLVAECTPAANEANTGQWL